MEVLDVLKILKYLYPESKVKLAVKELSGINFHVWEKCHRFLEKNKLRIDKLNEEEAVVFILDEANNQKKYKNYTIKKNLL